MGISSGMRTHKVVSLCPKGAWVKWDPSQWGSEENKSFDSKIGIGTHYSLCHAQTQGLSRIVSPRVNFLSAVHSSQHKKLF